MPQETFSFDNNNDNNRFASFTVNQLLEQEKNSVVALALAVMEARVQPREPIGGSNNVRTFLRLKMLDYQREVFAVLFLDNHHRLIEYEEMFQGSINSCHVYAREIVRRALEFNAGAIIFAHNHPSGIAEPSPADIDITKSLKDILSVIDVRVLDHMIVGEIGVVSMSEQGLI